MTVSKMEIVVNRVFRGELPEMVDSYNLNAFIATGYAFRVSKHRNHADELENNALIK